MALLLGRHESIALAVGVLMLFAAGLALIVLVLGARWRDR